MSDILREICCGFLARVLSVVIDEQTFCENLGNAFSF